MSRFRDHLRFAIRFAGIGYAVLWPFSTLNAGNLFGSALLCNASPPAAICSLPHPVQFGLGLHAAGTLCALLTLVDLAILGVRQLRPQHSAAVSATSATGEGIAAAPPKRLRRRRLPPPRRNLPARDHFGLRGLPHERTPVA